MDKEKDLMREEQKEMLRQRVLNTKDLEEERQLLVKIRNHKRKTRRKVMLAVMAIILMIAAYFIYDRVRVYHSYGIDWEFSNEDSNSLQYISFGDSLLQYSKNGASYISQKGDIIWTATYEMKHPKAYVQGDYVAIADINGTTIAIISKEKGLESTITNSYPISKIDIAKQGMVAVVGEASEVSYINYYQKDGTPLDIEIKTPLATMGYPLSMSLSPSGTQLVVSYLYVSGGIMKNKVVFYNMDEIGESYTDRLVGGFEHYAETNTMVGIVEFINENTAVAYGDNKLTIYSLERRDQPSIVTEIEYATQEEQLQVESICSDSNRIGIVFVNSNDEKELRVYNTKGKLQFKKTLDIVYDEIFMVNDFVVVYNTEKCTILNSDGSIKYNNEFEGGISKMIPTNSRSQFILITGNKVFGIHLK